MPLIWSFLKVIWGRDKVKAVFLCLILFISTLSHFEGYNFSQCKGLIVTPIITLKSQFIIEIIHDFAQQGIQCPILTF